MRRWVWVITAISLILSVAAGCSVDSGTNPPPPELDRKTPQNLIKYFADAYKNKDINKYLESLADAYLFEFDPNDYDLAGVTEDEPWWGKTEDETSTGKMFDDPGVSGVEMDLPIDTGPWATEDGLGFRLNPSIKVTVENPEGGEPTTYWVFSSWLYVEVIIDPYDSSLWVFKEINEQVKEGVLASADKGE